MDNVIDFTDGKHQLIMSNLESRAKKIDVYDKDYFDLVSDALLAEMKETKRQESEVKDG